MSDAGYDVGVDAGGTTTTAVLGKAGDVIRSHTGPAANATTAGVAEAVARICATIDAVLAGERAARIVVGAAGAGRESVAVALQAALALHFPHAHLSVVDDATIALRAAIAEGDGIVLIAGTGSVTLAQRGSHRVRLGGLGYLVGDEGSAFAIGMAAVRQLGRVHDGRLRADETSDLVARALDAPTRDAYLDALYNTPLVPARIASLAPSIIAFAGKGNRTSTKIVQAAAADLGELVVTTARLAELLQSSPTIALRGGLVRENSLLTFLLETRIANDVPGANIVRNGDEPSIGALRLAREARA